GELLLQRVARPERRHEVGVECGEVFRLLCQHHHLPRREAMAERVAARFLLAATGPGAATLLSVLPTRQRPRLAAHTHSPVDDPLISWRHWHNCQVWQTYFTYVFVLWDPPSKFQGLFVHGQGWVSYATHDIDVASFSGRTDPLKTPIFEDRPT